MQRVESAGQGAHGIIGEMRIGDVALLADEPEPSRQRAAAAVLDRVAERRDAGGLAEHAMVDALAARPQQLDEADRAVDRRAFLVAGQKESDRAFAGARRRKAQGGGERGGDAALHVGRAAPPQLALGDFRAERVMAPARNVAGRHDVGVAGEGEARRGGPEAGVEVLDIAEAQRLADEAGALPAGRAHSRARPRPPA